MNTEFRYSNVCRRAFTVIELLAVLTILGLLAGLVLPALSKARRTAQGAACRNNLSQLQKAWLSYAHDNDDTLPPNILRRTNFDVVNVTGSWVLGNAQLDTDSANLKAGVLYLYAPADKLYRCPADSSRVPDHPAVLKTRSYAIDQWLNCNPVTGTQQDIINDTPFNVRKLGRLMTPGPSKTWVFIEEHELSIETGSFSIPNPWWEGVYIPDTASWIARPANRHENGIYLSFADGHVDSHHWRYGRLSANDLRKFDPVHGPDDLADLKWLFDGEPQVP